MTDFLSPLGFQFQCDLLPTVSDFVQQVNVPGMSIGWTNTPTPFVTLSQTSDHVDFDGISVRFKIDKELRNYEEAFRWIEAATFPDSYDQRKAFQEKNKTLKGNGSLAFLNAQFSKTCTFFFEDLVPVGLSGFQMNTDAAGVQYLDCLLTMKFTKFRFERNQE
ncbi:tail completion and sheath stabilizer [Caulobacter phage Cr30]|uniref:tail completion and sheath stabilizer n=1 Tax=Caulobacter phage Cr30 TaxID=1357714 RepID=UPI0004A9B54B|nr:tail completion and sheath stabilizer [Caulobacter phage Cr30]AGS81051.1 tail completion and sheath stabilizer [Caulobacter phage Cr30]